MTALDTNVVVRFLVADEPEQHARAVALLTETLCFVPDTVLLESVWVLRSSYGFSRAQIAEALRRFLGLANVHTADPQRTRQVLAWYDEGLDFADAFHLAASQHLDRMASFDQPFIRRAQGRGTCSVEEP